MRVQWEEANRVVGQSELPEFRELVLDSIRALIQQEDPATYVVIVDEAHHLHQILIDDTIPIELRTKIQRWFDGCHKLLLLTGTPISSTSIDLAQLINLAALPLDSCACSGMLNSRFTRARGAPTCKRCRQKNYHSTHCPCLFFSCHIRESQRLGSAARFSVQSP